MNAQNKQKFDRTEIDNIIQGKQQKDQELAEAPALRIIEKRDSFTVEVTRDFTDFVIKSFKRTMTEVMEVQGLHILVDLREVTDISIQLVKYFCTITEKIETGKGVLCFLISSDRVMDVIKSSGMAHRLKIARRKKTTDAILRKI